MSLTLEEKFALRMIFRGSDPTSVAVLAQLDAMDAKQRKATGVGFFTSIRLAIPLRVIEPRHKDWNFRHRLLSHGGSFMCTIEDPTVLELEAVSHNGDWPHSFHVEDFIES
ncbi:hypothetical protein LMG32289_02163 [Cupriavidus pampae]|uniref:Uncharacterized protein n=2 Tax=Cupriavidus pampae TaxID=659251 RepID=A0ABN7YEV9_9BURK|nr:hypothetical protein LMG32289_02163 [Cupriavidus pampae]